LHMFWQPLELLPLWSIFLLTCLIVALPLEIGYRLGRRHHLRGAGESDPSIGVVVASILGLLAFLLAFTFNMAASRYEDRRQVVLQEANAIETAYLRTRLLPEHQHSEAAGLLRQYVDIRVQAARPKVSPEELARDVARSEEIQRRIWGMAMRAAEQDPTVMTGLFIQALNQVFDIHSERVLVGVHSQIPFMIWMGLLGVAMIGLASAGFQAGCTSTRRSIVIFGLVLAFAGVMTLIADLDNPREGFLKTQQGPILVLQQSMHKGRNVK
jgi:hypothetical protein